MMHVPPYHPRLAALAFGAAAIVALGWLAYRLRGAGQTSAGDTRGTAPAWLAGLTAFVMGALWYAVITQVFVPKPIQPWWLVLVVGVAWAVLAFALFWSWASRLAWGPIHPLGGFVWSCAGVHGAPLPERFELAEG